MQLDRFVSSTLIGCMLTFAAATAAGQPSGGYKQLYTYAEKLSNAAHPTDKTDQLALASYKKVIELLTTTNGDAPFLLKAYVSTGSFLQALNRGNEAIPFFKKAFLLKQNTPAIPDSALFKPLVYCGNSYYQQDHLDSAEALYNKARAIAARYPQVSELERLYNTLGVIAYSTGNYKQSLAFYEKALSTLLAHPTADKALLATYKSNIASAYRKLNRYAEALKLYKEVLQYQFEPDKLMHNIGAVYLAMGQNDEAVTWLKKVKYQNQKKLNDLGKAYLNKKDNSNALLYLNQAEALNTRLGQSQKNSDHGITLKYLGDVWRQQDQPKKALIYYQQAINNLMLDFIPADIYRNPANFNSVFNGIELMEVLQAKAEVFRLLYLKSSDTRDLLASLQTYNVFYKLADHIERFYDTDDARLQISNRKYASRQQPIAVCLQLYALSKNKRYMEQAFYFDEENKANTLSINLHESKLKAQSGIPAGLLKQETRLKENITRVSLQASGETDSSALVKLKRIINDNTIKLLAVQQKINNLTVKYRRLHGDTGINITTLQQNIPAKGAILSYHIGDNGILCFVITHTKFDFFTKPLDAGFGSGLKEILKLAQLRSGNNIKQVRGLGNSLYRQLMKPAETLTNGKEDLMIIPDDELNYLPFELLADDEGVSLLKRYTITYNYSCNSLQNSNSTTGDYTYKLGMAPFNEKLSTGDLSAGGWAQLPASKKEIEAMGGVALFDRNATKQQFLSRASQFNIIHLATHAYANDKDPNQSFIAFYPALRDSAINYKLYLPEIYNLKLDKTQLVILSACESGSGELVKGEGVMSLSRAFSYAGCNHIITTMWKADDASTAYLSARLHHYLQKGYTISRALQQAQLDYQADDNISPSKKLPGYWAHMRLIGNFQQETGNNYMVFLIAAALILCLIMALKNRGRIKRSRLQ